ncbi:MAG: LLM class flavin-dependent oxidoreductase [Candidatus Tectomicrobia bacterium]|uniref:LLM class flavin-dependent oxidoreductase n=1 Tax=Tectimicrobiota bacterium TaxID=2528274 RepID=A0A937W1M3_UNCTE|nr:LLM class flavin-dependent oxidoreductase [Candidatus Tectomicrobia bacterium]
MKFGLFSHIPWPEELEPQQIFVQTAEAAQCGEELGFVSLWLAEHHFSRYGLGSSSLLLASHIAARTKTIRLGTAVLVPTLHHPLRLAEDTATLDVLSGGRLDVGYGRGAAGYEYNGYMVDREHSQERFREAITMIQGLWTTPEYTHTGQFFSVNRANLVPRPLQQPHPPVYVAATRTPATLEFVLATGHPLIVGVVLDTTNALDLCQRFVTRSAALGHHVPMSAIPFFRYCYVAETEAQARKDTEAALNWNMDVNQWRRMFAEGSEVHGRLDDFRRSRTETPPSYDYLCEHRAFIGTPDQCAAKIKALQDQGIEYFGCNFAFGDLDHKKVLASMELFAKEVMPRFL